jgi:hypothetical protein
MVGENPQAQERRLGHPGIESLNASLPAPLWGAFGILLTDGSGRALAHKPTVRKALTVATRCYRNTQQSWDRIRQELWARFFFRIR